MAENALEELKQLDRDALVERMGAELCEIRMRLNISQEALADKTGVNVVNIGAVESGERSLKWSEYMSILLVIWNNDIGRGIIESKGLFPDVLKKAMSVNRNAHAPLTESAKFGF